MSILATIEGCDIHYQASSEIVTYTAKAAIDGDGSSGNTWNDPDWQGDTSLHFEGKALNAETEAYIVVPPAIIQGTKGKVLGSQATVTDPITGKSVSAVVADIGPAKKLGEISIQCARLIAIPESPLTGGESRHIIQYEIQVGVPAQANGKTYSLQSA